MRFLLKSTGIALGLTIVVYVLCRLLVPSDAWFHTFLYDRSLVQWLSIAVFFFGLHLLYLKSRALPLETRALDSADWTSLTANPVVAPPSAGMVRRRLTTVASLTAHHSPRFAESTAKEMADDDASALNESYALPGEVIQILPLIGFFGTVWGLSKGLYNNFVVQGQDSTNAFASAIGTAFDTTLLALFLTITMSLLQSVVRRTEESLLERLNRYVDERLHQLDDAVASALPASNDPKVWLEEFGINPNELIEFLRGRLTSIGENLQKLVSTNTALASGVSDAQREVLAALAAGKTELTGALHQSGEFTRAALDAGQKDLAGALAQSDKALLAALTHQAELLQQLKPADHTDADQRQLALLASLEALAKARATDATAQARTHAENLRELQEQLKQQHAAATAATAGLADGVAKVEGAVAAASTRLADGIGRAGEAAQIALKSHDERTAAAVNQLGETVTAGQQSLRNLIVRPKAFTVTEKPAADDASQA